MKRVLPVIHVSNQEQVLRNAMVANEAGAHGVFLISHGADNPLALNRLAREVKEIINWIGVNYLSLGPDESFVMLPPHIAGLWVDNAGIDEYADEQTIADAIRKTHLEEVKWRSTAQACESVEYFGGVAFKYQRPVYELAKAAEIAKGYMDVVTTSGEGTGMSADILKIQEMRKGLGPEARLGIASGITPENVDKYLPYVDDFLVATGISQDFFNLDPNKTRELVERVNQYVYPS